MRNFRLLLVLLGALLAATACNRVEMAPAAGSDAATPASRAPAPARAPEDAPNVLLVSIDTLRADHVGAFGAGPDRTPTLDALAARGVVFERAFSPAPLTLPSHASLLTGLYPSSHGVRHNGLFVLEEGIPTLAERFRQAGWTTGAVVGAMVLDPRFGLDRGFDAYDAAMGSRTSARGGYLHRTADQVTRAALARLEESPGPFFLWVHYFDPHGSYAPPDPWASRFAADPYAGEIAFTDAELGRLLEALEAQGRLENTLVAVVADHGESLGEHGEISHSYSLYDATQHVPMILAGPGLPEGRRVLEVVSLVDLGPTLLARTGLPALPEADGHDLSPAIEGGAAAAALAEREGVYAETLAPQLDHGFAPLRAVRSDRWLHVRAPRPELYDVRADPAQVHNLLEEGEAETPARLAALLDRVVANEKELAPSPLDAETRAQLQALGYALPTRTLVSEGGIDPKDGLPLAEAFERANTLYFAGQVVEAQRIASRLEDDLADSARLHHLLALIHLTLNRPQEVVRHVDKLKELAPENAEHYVILGFARLAMGQLEQAVAAFEQAARLEPDNAQAASALMWRAALTGDPAPAEEAARRALALEPNNASLAVSIGENWERLGNPARAREAYRRAVELDPRSEQGHVGLAAVAAWLGEPEQAERHLAAAGEAAAGVAARMRVAISYAKGGDLARAEALVRQVTEANPELEGPRRLLARIQERAAAGAAGAPPAGS